NQIFTFLFLFFILTSSVFAQNLSSKQLKQIKSEIEKAKKEIIRLEKKLKVTKNKKLRGIIVDKIDIYRAQIKKLESRSKPQPKVAVEPKEVPKYLPISPEVVEEAIITTEVITSEKEKRFKQEVGAVFGLFSGATLFAVEARFSLPYVFGPVLTTSRLALGLAQSKDMDRRYVPINFDFILKFPPGWFSGVENYLGAGLNYVAYTSGGRSGTFGGQAFYGVESEGFGGMVFGELGYGVLRTGFSPSHKGVTVLVGYRKF
ncbi:MAG: hypothetical protein ACPL4K_06705, partial [Candidatus Margulisiibacteriota bacterium]